MSPPGHPLPHFGPVTFSPSPMSSVHRSNNFDLIRLLAAAQVVLSHAIGHTPLYATLTGWQKQLFDGLVWLPGVPVFFVISGFLISRSYERMQGDLAGYAWNRALRIFPALWICLLVTLIVLGLFGYLTSSFLSSPTFLGWLAGQISFVQFFNPEQFRSFGVGVANGSLWTITVELQFYVFIPLLYATIYGKWSRGKLRSILLGLLFFTSYIAYCVMNVKLNGPGGFSGGPPVFKLMFNTLLPHLWMFMVGILIHRHFEKLRPLMEGKVLLYFLPYLSLAAVMQWLIPHQSIAAYALLLPARILLGLATISAAYSMRHLSGKILRGTDISYGLYIYHFIVINAFIEKSWLGSFSAIPLIFLTSVVLALLSWYLIEKPALSCKSLSLGDLLAKLLQAKAKSPDAT